MQPAPFRAQIRPASILAACLSASVLLAAITRYQFSHIPPRQTDRPNAEETVEQGPSEAQWRAQDIEWRRREHAWNRRNAFVNWVSSLIALAALIFLGFQTYQVRQQTSDVSAQTGQLASQTREVGQQTQALVDQTRTSAVSLGASETTAQLQFNLQVMARLDDMLLTTGEDPHCFQYVWGSQLLTPSEGSKAIQCGDAIIDVLSMALKAVNQMPCFSPNGSDWFSYTHYVMLRSPNLRNRIKAHPDWWPEVTPYINLKYLGPPANYTDSCDKIER